MTLEFSFASKPSAGAHVPALRGVVGSGNLEVLIVAAPASDCRLLVHTSARGFRDIWHAVLESFASSHAAGRLKFVINDMGATPAVVTLRLSQALADEGRVRMMSALLRRHRARPRRAALRRRQRSQYLPQASAPSPHLARLGLPSALDDGVVVGETALAGRAPLFAPQEGQFMGGAVGEVHGAKIVGLLSRAREARPAAVVLLVDSGGVRLHEANARGSSRFPRSCAPCSTRAAGVPVLALIGGVCSAFGGMGRRAPVLARHHVRGGPALALGPGRHRDGRGRRGVRRARPRA